MIGVCLLIRLFLGDGNYICCEGDALACWLFILIRGMETWLKYV